MEDSTTNNRNFVFKLDTWSVIRAFLVIALLIVIYFIRDIIFLFLVAFVLSLLTTPIVDHLSKRKFPRMLATIFIYLLVIFVVVGIIVPLIPLISQQINLLIQRLPAYYDQVNSSLRLSNKSWSEIIKNLISGWVDQPTTATKSLFGVLGTVAGWALVLVTVFVMAFYLTLQKDWLKNVAKQIFPERQHDLIVRLFDLIQKDISCWARGVLIGALIISIVTYIGLSILGIHFALILALLAGFGEFIPWFGSIFTAVVAVLVALTQSPLQALMVLIFYIVIQQIQGNFIMPKVMQRAVGINPLLIVLALLIGGRLGGFIGLVLAVPILTIILILVREYLHLKKENLSNK